MADLLVILIVVIAAILGYKKGLVHSVFNFGHHIVSLVAAILFYPVVTDWLSTTTLQQKIYELVSGKIGNGADVSQLPSFMQEAVKSGTQAMTDATATMLTQVFLTIIAVLIVFVGVKIILWIVSLFVKTVTKLPIIKGVNKIGGFFFGILSGIIIAYVALAIVSMFPGSTIYSYVQLGSLSKNMLDNNLILNLIFK
ncbi:MAG: CvpA family protein [Clostridia bacterium]|nr:CvpA family protein [Clostridia bacterium]